MVLVIWNFLKTTQLFLDSGCRIPGRKNYFNPCIKKYEIFNTTLFIALFGLIEWLKIEKKQRIYLVLGHVFPEKNSVYNKEKTSGGSHRKFSMIYANSSFLNAEKEKKIRFYSNLQKPHPHFPSWRIWLSFTVSYKEKDLVGKKPDYSLLFVQWKLPWRKS